MVLLQNNRKIRCNLLNQSKGWKKKKNHNEKIKRAFPKSKGSERGTLEMGRH